MGDYQTPWKVIYWVRCEEWDKRSCPRVVAANGKVVAEMLQTVDHPGLYDCEADTLAQRIAFAVNTLPEIQAALLSAGISNMGTMAEQITRLATQRDAALCGIEIHNPDRCPACGYTELDARELADHYLCANYPFFSHEQPLTRSKL